MDSFILSAVAIFIFKKMPPGRFFNTLKPRQKDRHFADDIFQHVFYNENFWILDKISLKCVP